MGATAGFIQQSRVKDLVRSLRQHHRHDRRQRACGDAKGWTMDILLHVGAHRTGTTGFQTLLQGQQSRLRRSGIVFWGPKRTRSGLLSGLIKDTDHLTKHDHQRGLRSCGRMAMEIARLSDEGAQSLVISEENMIGTMAGNLASGSLYRQARARLARFAPAFCETTPTIALAVRCYHLHWASQLAFRVKLGALVPGQADIDAMAAQPRDWQDVIRDLREAFPTANIVVWRFEDWAHNPSGLLDSMLGRPAGLQKQAMSGRSNASATVQTLVELVQERGDISGVKLLQSSHDGLRYMPFSPSQQSDLQHLYEDDLAWLRAGADGCATYLDPAEGTFGGYDMTKGSSHERQKASVASPR